MYHMDFIDNQIIKIQIKPNYSVNIPLAIFSTFFSVSDQDEFCLTRSNSWTFEPIEFRSNGEFVDLVPRESVTIMDLYDSLERIVMARALIIDKENNGCYYPCGDKPGDFLSRSLDGIFRIKKTKRSCVIPFFGPPIEHDYLGNDKYDIIPPEKAIKTIQKTKILNRPNRTKENRVKSKDATELHKMVDESIEQLVRLKIIEKIHGKDVKIRTIKITPLGINLARTGILRIDPVMAKKGLDSCYSRLAIDAHATIGKYEKMKDGKKDIRICSITLSG